MTETPESCNNQKARTTGKLVQPESWMDHSPHKYTDGTLQIVPIVDKKSALRIRFRRFWFYFCGTNTFVQDGKQHQCIGGCIIRGNDIFAPHCLFNRTLPINSAGESVNGNMFFQDSEIKKEKPSTITVPDQYRIFKIFLAHLISH
jgi:hypothetical protein